MQISVNALDDSFSDADISPEDESEEAESEVSSSRTDKSLTRSDNLPDEARGLFHGLNILPDTVSLPEVTKGRLKGEAVVECQGFEDVAPDLCRIRTPFLPFWWERRDFEAFRLAQEHAWWKRRLAHLADRQQYPTSGFFMTRFGEMALQGEAVGTSGNKSFELKALVSDCGKLLERSPLGPESLTSSSCLQTTRVDGELHLVFAKGNTLHIKKLISTDDDSLFRYELSEDKSRDLVNYDLPLESRVYGFASIPADPTLFAIRHRKSVSLLDLEGDILKTWKRRKDVLSVAALPQLDGVAMLEASGSLSMNSYETLETSNVWEDVFSTQIGRFFWTSMQESGNASVLRVATRKLISLFDVRSGVVDRCIFAAENNKPCLEVIGAICQSKKHAFQFYCTSSEGLHLIDERWSKNRLQTWRYLSPELMIGCENVLIEGTEYIASYSADGVIHMLANDWKHSLCHLRSTAAATKLSCQTKSSKVRYPVSRGRAVTIPSIRKLCNVMPFSSSLQEKALLVPWTGLTLLSDKPNELTTFTLNAAGTIFSCEIEPRNEESDSAATVQNLWLNNEMDVTARQMSLSWLQKWDTELEADKFPKKSVLTALSERDDKFYRKYSRNSIIPKVKKVRKKKRKVRKEDVEVEVEEDLNPKCFPDDKEKGQVKASMKEEPNRKRKKHRPRNIKMGVYTACASLKPMDHTEHSDGQGRRVHQIFEGENIFPDVFGTDSDVPSSSGGLSDNSSFSLPAEERITMEDFLENLDPFMTSTQQTDEGSSAPLTASQQTNFGSQNMSIHKTPKKKRKSGFQTGF